jgi:hypothetical protein
MPLSLRFCLKACFKASFVLLFFLLSLVLSLSIWDLYHFWGRSNTQNIATVTTQSVSPQRFTLVLEATDEVPIHFEMNGDMWQLDARLLVWDDYWHYLGISSLYRFERLSGRYNSIEDERNNERTLYSLWEGISSTDEDEHSFFSDFKRWVTAYTWFPGVNLLYGGSVYVPVIDGAVYKVQIYNGRLQVLAANDKAKDVLVQW